MKDAFLPARYLVPILCLCVVHGRNTVHPNPNLAPDWLSCGDGHCQCFNNRADCSHQRLIYIPRLDENITDLDLSYNNFPNLSKSSWDNITVHVIVILNISSCHIQYLARETFEDFTNLMILKFNENPVFLPDLTASLLGPDFQQLEILYLRNLNISDVSFFLKMSAPNLKNVHIDNNILTVYNQSVFSKFRKIRVVTANNNQITTVTFSYSESLLYLALKKNLIITLPGFCNDGQPHLPRLQILSFDFNVLGVKQICFDCLPRVWHLGLSGNAFKVIRRNTFSKLTDLKVLWLTHLQTHPSIEPYAFNNSQLQQLHLTFSEINFSAHVDSNAFKYSPKLFALYLTMNNFRHVTDRHMLNLFGHLANLKIIEMAYCYLETIPIFINRLKNMTSIRLSGNSIKNIPDGRFNNFSQLKVVELNKNRISIIKESTFSKNTIKQLSSINLAENPFNCDCDLRWFLNWTQREEKRLFYWYPEGYRCNSPASKRNLLLNEVFFGQNACLLSITVIASILGTSAVFVFVVFLLSILYKLRWHIRHHIYMKYYRPRQQLAQQDAHEYIYDAYIIHSDEDEDWVVEEMLPCLEDQHHMKLCVPGRDFLPGGYILNNIDQAIQTSRHIIVVLSPSFVESEWCQAELSMAQSFVLDTRANPLLTVLLEEPDARNMRHSLHVLLRSTAYIIWGEEEEAKQLFWRRLVESLCADGS